MLHMNNFFQEMFPKQGQYDYFKVSAEEHIHFLKDKATYIYIYDKKLPIESLGIDLSN